MAAKEFIVAIELGSSKMTGIAGKKNLDGSITVHAIVKEDSSSFIQKGVVYNIDKTAQCITTIINKLSTKLKTRINMIYVGIGGQSIRSILNVVPKDLASPTQITQDIIDEMSDTNRNMNYPDQTILDVAIQEYLVDNQLQTDPVGVQCTKLEGNYLNILQRKAFYEKLYSCLEKAGVTLADIYLAPLMLADAVLTETERRSGCALVDIGASTTTVSVYSKNILRHLAVIPLGSNNITKDIATSLNIEESEAERLKLKYASAYTEYKDIEQGQTIVIDADHNVEEKKFVDIVEGRIQEIVENVLYQIPQHYANNLLGGIIITGGGSNIPNIDKAFTIDHQHIEKIRIARTITATVKPMPSDIKKIDDGTLCTVLGLLAKGDRNCAGNEMSDNPGIFDTQETHTDTNINSHDARDPKPFGVIDNKIEEERKKEEERKREEERRKEEERQEKLREEEEKRKRRENSPLNKGLRGIKGFLKSMIKPDEE